MSRHTDAQEALMLYPVQKSPADESVESWIVMLVAFVWLTPGGVAAAGPDGPSIQVAAETGIERLEDDYYLGVTPKLGLGLDVPQLACREAELSDSCRTRFRADLHVPIRLRVIDRREADESVWRRRDWDEVGDYLKVMRRLEYGRRSEPVFARAGELGSVVLGHGTIVNHYFNVVTPDHYRLGLEGSYKGRNGGGEILVGDFIRPSVFGGRAYVRPTTFIDGAEWWRRLSLGVTLVADVTAPEELDRRASESPVVGPATRPAVEQRQATAIGGVDLEVQAVQTDHIGLAPYADFNRHFGLGNGMHTGLDLAVAPTDRLRFAGRAEYRLLGQNYLPDYFGPLYEINRYQFSGWGALLPQPKLKLGAGVDGGPRHGLYGELQATFGEMVSLSGAMAQHEGPANGWARLGLQVSMLERARLGAFYYRHGFDALSNLFDSNEAFLVAESRVTVWGPLYLKGAYSRLWQLHDDGLYESVNRWSVGAGVSLSL